MKPFLIIFLLIILGVASTPFVLLNLYGQPLLQIYDRRTRDMNEDSEVYKQLFSETFDKARTCTIEKSEGCKEEVQRDLMAILKRSDLNTPEYYIRLTPDGRIQKLFMSSEVEETVPKTEGEYKVQAFLRGKTNNILWNTWRTNSDDSTTLFLEDLYSEAEVVIPFKVNNSIVGAIVYLYGD